MPEHTITDTYRHALAEFEATLGELTEPVWELAPPCTEWTVRDLVGHVLGGVQFLHSVIGNGQPPDERFAHEPPGPLCGADPLATWVAARTAAETDLAEAELDREHAGFGGLALREFLRIHTLDVTTHLWDLRTAAGLDRALPGDLLEATAAWVAENAEQVATGGLFAAALTPPEGADAQTRLLAQLGRRAW
ncbi:TIGR03086 family metal-binding protein [Sciscionella sediminilitoris]|uniref:TIGR03086 family metal-binding protein n=1 Tax=Sciscionella sediminilitoris TaxID=1445613 RepID=UPI00069082C2|nr:TIGR03086 family metal-binding protein [Sciscionella sp. SE31]